MKICYSDAERTALSELPYFVRCLYYEIRPLMDYSTGTVGNSLWVTYGNLAKAMYVKPHTGESDTGVPSLSRVKRAVQRLETAGLIENQSICTPNKKQLIFRLPLAFTNETFRASSVSSKQDHSAAKPKSEPVHSPTPEKIEETIGLDLFPCESEEISRTNLGPLEMLQAGPQAGPEKSNNDAGLSEQAGPQAGPLSDQSENPNPALLTLVLRKDSSTPEQTSVVLEGGAGEKTVTPATPGATSTGKKKRKTAPEVLITADWMPSNHCLDLISSDGIPKEFAMKQIGEFVLYWLERQEKRPGWNSTFLRHIKSLWKKEQSTQPFHGRSVNGTRRTPAPDNFAGKNYQEGATNADNAPDWCADIFRQFSQTEH